MSPLFRSRRGRITATFAGHEASILANLIAQIVELIRDGAPEPESTPSEDSLAALIGSMDASGEPPEDPILARLFPDAYSEDRESAGEFRRYTERGLRDAKVANARVVLETLGDPSYADRVSVDLGPEESQAWLRTLTDVRLALGVRLEVTEDDEERWESLPDSDPRRAMHDVYLWLGYLQDSLVHAVSRT